MSKSDATTLTDTLWAIWTLGGVAALFASATYRLGAQGLATIKNGLGFGEWSALIVLTMFFVYGEGVRALDRRWVPQLVARARRLRRKNGWMLRVFAPLYGLSLIGAARGDLKRAWLGTTAIVGAVLIVRALPAPWRGIVDFAVAAALAWGLLAIIRRFSEVLPSAPHCR